ncbi:MAG: OmpH family outer membrane protein [Phycisphaerae bacterium]|nr:OmpH family outer membrane protein [Phycisphaerae bacterium]
MKNAFLLVGLMFGVTVFALSFQNDIQAQSGSATMATKVVAVDVAKTLSVCKESIEREQDQNKKAAVINEKLTAYDKKAKAILAGLKEGFEPDSELYNQQMQEFFKVKAEAEALQGYETKRMERENRVWVEMLYGKLLAATSDIAKQQGATLVVNLDGIPMQDSNITIENLYKIISNRKVLYVANQCDITDSVIELMDAAYAEAKKNKK